MLSPSPMQSLMQQASACLDSGKNKTSYQLYIEALSLATQELKQLQFVNQYAVVENNLSSVFVLAQTCLRHAKTISLKQSSPPPIPAKPLSLSLKPSPPPLPSRPATLYRARSKPELVKTCNLDLYSSADQQDEQEMIVNKGTGKKASSSSLKSIKTRPNIPRRLSTSNLVSSSAPSSPLSSVPNPLNAVKSFLSLPGSIDGKRGMYASMLDSDSGDDIFLLSNSTIDPHVLAIVQTSASDSLSTPHSQNYLPMIPQAPLVTLYQSLQKQLQEAIECKKIKSTVSNNQQVLDIQSSLERVRNIHMSATTVPTILQFQPVLIAYQLTLIDSTIFRNIPVDAILSHAPKTPHPSIVASTDFFNYLTRLIEHAILLQQDASGRAQHINYWIKVAGKCHELKNYQTLKAIISALGTPPIQRLKRSWQFIPKKSMNLLEDLSDLMSEASNYGKYRERLGLSQSGGLGGGSGVVGGTNEDEVKNRAAPSEDTPLKKSFRKNSFSEPTVPFLGIFIHDMTYLVAALSKRKQHQQQHNSEWKIESSQSSIDILRQDARVSELLKLFKDLQRSPPYSPNVSASCVKDLNKSRKRKLSHALGMTSAMKKNYYSQDDDGELGIEMQQCLVTQYLLTRSWVSEKTVDELSLVREPTKRSLSVSDSLASCSQSTINSLPPPPPPLLITSLAPTDTFRSSSGSLTSGDSVGSRPISLEDETDQKQYSTDETMDKKPGSFWLFGRKSVDQGYLKSGSTEHYGGTIQRSPRHFSFEELNGVAHKKFSESHGMDGATFRMHREGSQGSLATSIFRKDFWKSSPAATSTPPSPSVRVPLINFNSEPSVPTAMQRKGSSASSVLTRPSPSTSTSSCSNEKTRPLHNKNLRHVLSSPHPLDIPSSSEIHWN